MGRCRGQPHFPILPGRAGRREHAAGLLPSQLHQQGQVVGRGLDSLYVRFAGNEVVSLSPRLLRLLTDTPDGEAHREGPG
ncbi:MAG: hypothetical protein ACRDUW_10415 [Pseudonocardiaceae bacterium]